MPIIPHVLRILLLAAIVPALAATTAAAEAQTVPEKSLLRDPALKVPGGKGAKAPAGCWGGVAAGRGTFEFRNDGSDLYCQATSEGPARLQFGAAVTFDERNPSPPPGTLIRAGVWVRGSIRTLGEGGQGPVLRVQVDGPAKGAAVDLGPKMKPGTKGKPPTVEAVSGEVPWTRLEIVFALPANSQKIAMLMYLMNADGTVEWKNPSLSVAENAAITFAMPERFQTRAEVAAAQAPQELEKYRKRMTDLRARFNIPPTEELCQANAKFTGPHPRYLFAGTPVPTMKARYRDPAFAAHSAKLKATALAIAAEAIPAKPNMDAEDPLRPYAEKIAPMALLWVLEDDPATRQTVRAGLDKWVDATLAWGLPLRDLPLSQQMFALGAVYDWLCDDLAPAQKSALRAGLIARARWMVDPANVNALQWRGTQHTANHNWFNYGGLAMCAVVLWGETEAPLQAGEVQNWLADAMVNFYVVEALQPKDGGAMEGYLYQDYGLRPYFDFAALADQLIAGRHSFVETDSVRNLSSRIFSLLPGNAGFFTFSDADPDMFGSAASFRYIASRLHDPRAQRLAQIMDEEHKPKPGVPDTTDWRSLFWSDPAIPAANLADLPTSNDATDLGLFTARSGWDDRASFFGLRCGPPCGRTAAAIMGDGYANGHVHPEQGNFSFYVGPHAVIPGTGYARTKLTTHANVVVFEGMGKQSGKMVDQLGGGQAWFGMGNTYAGLLKHATVLAAIHRPDAHSYLCDLGGVYRLEDARAKGGYFYPTYLRNITYLTSGAVAIVDRIETPQPRTCHFRLLTAAKDLKPDGNDFTFTINGAPGRIRDLSPQPLAHAARKEEVFTWRNPQRNVAVLTATDQTRVLFAAVIGLNGADRGVDVKADDTGVTVATGYGEPIIARWQTAAPLVKKP